MKKLFVSFICIAMLIAAVTPAYATSQENVITISETTLDNGLTVIDQVVISSSARTTDTTATRTKTIKDGDTVIAVIAFQATFRHDGATVSVVSKSVTQTDTYDGWEYVQNSFTSSGSTVSLSAKLTKWIILNTSFTMTLSCDKDGNISYT